MNRLTYLIDSLAPGGAQSQLGWVVRAIDRTRYRPALAWYNDTARFFTMPDDVPALRLAHKGRLDPRFAGSMARLVSTRQSDIVHAWLAAPALYAALARLRPGSVPVINAVGCAASYFRHDPIAGRMHVLAARLADHTTVNCRDVIEWLAERGIDRQRISYVPNILPPPIVERQPSSPAERAAMLQRFDLDPARPPITQLARIDRNKNPHGLLAAVLRLRDRGVEVPPLLLAGFREDRGLVAELERTATAAGFHDLRVVDAVADVPTLVEASRFTVLASSSEGTPNVVLEALGLGGLVLATRVGEVPALIRHGETGLSCPPDDVEALAALIQQALDMPEAARRALGARAREDVVARYSPHSVLSGLCDLYDEVRARARSPWRRLVSA